MASNDESGVNLLESLRNPDNHRLEEKVKELREREEAHNAKAAQRLKDLIASNSTLPVTISSIRLIDQGSQHTRRSFLDRLFNPILSANRDAPYTLSEALQEAGSAADKLRRFEIYHDVSMFIDKPSPTDPSSTPSDINIFLSARERGRVNLKTGTDIGNVEGSAYGNLLWRNIFGGAESLSLNASKGTRTRSSYQAVFDTPIASDPDKHLTIDALASATSKPWASHEEVLKGAGLKYSWAAKGGSRHQVSYSGVWRQITNLAAGASPTVRNDAGDSVKSSISHIWTSDHRDNPLLPSRGYLLKTVSEIAGWGPLRGD
ncbi:SAM50-like protein, partial [Lachnellula willkommii]